MDISVIVPCYNSQWYVRSCLKALLEQSYPRDRYQVLLVNNRSTDRSAEFAREFPTVVILEASKQGSYAARNVGVGAATGRILAFTDSDCEVCPTWLEQIAAAMQHEDTAVVLGARRFARETLLLSTLADYEMEKARYVFSQDDPSLYYGYTNNMAVRRGVYQRVGPFVEISRGADVILVSRVLQAYGCDSVKFLPELLVRHMEIGRWFEWHRKLFLYGRGYQGYRHISRTRPLSYPIRLEVLRRAARRHRHGLVRTLLMLAFGIVATVAYEVGRMCGRKA
jgi:glycosyltransferase involved in cell wall biosynthesis